VHSVDASGADELLGKKMLSFEMRNGMQGTTTLNIGTIRDTAVPNTVPVRIRAGEIGELIVYGSVENRDEFVTKKVDVNNLQVINGDIVIPTWERDTTVNIGNKNVRVSGGAENKINIIANAGTVIDLTENPNYQVNVNEGEIDIGVPHLFYAGGDHDGSFQVFIGTTRTDYEYVLKCNGEKINFITQFMNENGEVGGDDPIKTHLVPIVPITDLTADIPLK